MPKMAGSHHAERRERRLRGDEGAAIVEFALLLPLLAVVVFGTVDLGRAYELQNAVTNMAREGAFMALTNPCPTSRPIAAATNENPDLAGKVTVKLVQGTDTSASNISCSSAPATGTPLTMVVTTKMKVITPLVAAIVGTDVSITGKATVAAP